MKGGWHPRLSVIVGWKWDYNPGSVVANSRFSHWIQMAFPFFFSEDRVGFKKPGSTGPRSRDQAHCWLPQGTSVPGEPHDREL